MVSDLPSLLTSQIPHLQIATESTETTQTSCFQSPETTFKDKKSAK